MKPPDNHVANHQHESRSMMPRVILVRTAFFGLLWFTLTGGSFYGWITGLVTICLATAVSLRLHPPGRGYVRLTGIPAFFLFFLGKSIKGGIQVAAMAAQPRLQLHPDLLEIRLRLPHESEQIFLASILSLLPGTLSAGLEGNRLQLHVLDSRLPVEQEVRDAEAHVARLFGTALP